VNNICKAVGARNCLLVSIHNNAGGGDGKWHDACGWSVFVSKNASENSKKLARMLTVEAMKRELMGNRSVPLQKYWTWSWTNKDIYILKKHRLPSSIDRELFQDHKGDVDNLLSEAGMTELVDLHVDGITKYIECL
jgi:N-acetylmuramoyl-L-alanine amidase